MEVSMDTSPGLSPPSLPPGTNGPNERPGTHRKRSLQDVENGVQGHEAEDQENTDPGDAKGSLEGGGDDRKGESEGEEGGSGVRVEIPLSSIPTPNVTTDSTTTAKENGNANADANANDGNVTPATKKRRVSPASKEAKQQEKEAKERQKAEDKAKKEEEKAKKDEEKRVKDEEKKKRDGEREEERKRREEKKRVKDEERAVKEEEKKKKEEEKSKKERAQMKLNAFFAKPKAAAESSSFAGPAGSPKKHSGDSAAIQGTKEAVSDYQRVFPEFFLQSHTKVAPPHRFQRDSEALEVMRQRVDESLKSNNDGSQPAPVFRPSEVFRLIPYKRRRGRQAASVKDILLQIQNMGSSEDGIGATTEVKPPGQRPQDLLNQVRMKSLKFGEDVRPPYQGTYTRTVSEPSAYKISRNPFSRCLPDTNYDYDSEAEWEEPEEGEDLDSEEEEEAEDEVDDDMEGFLDDEDDQPVDGKRRLIVGDLEPRSTGLRWQENGGVVDPALAIYKVETISDSVTLPIDPFSTAYWQKSSDSGPPAGGPSTMEGSEQTLSILGTKSKRSFPPEQMAEFKSVVDGSDLTKMGLVEILKKRFPKVSKEVLKDTLTGTASRVGSKESEKKWVCK